MTLNSKNHKTTTPSIGLDRLVLSVVLNPNYYKGKGERKIRPEDHEMLEYMLSSLNASDNIICLKKHKKGLKGDKPIPNRYLLQKEGRNLMDIMWGYQYGKPFFRIGLNAGKLQEADYPLISAELLSLLPNWADFKAHFFHWELSRLELCIDLPNVDPSDITLLSMGNHCHTRFDESTEYNGNRHSRLCVVKYDKQKHLLEKEGIDIGHPMTRVEVRVQERRKSVHDFMEMGEVDFYKKFFHHPLVSIQCSVPDPQSPASGEGSKSSWEGGAGALPFSLQDQEALSPEALYARVVQTISALAAAAAPATGLHEDPVEMSENLKKPQGASSHEEP